MSCSAEDIATILEALPAVTVESPLPAFEQLAGNDVNFANVGGDLNLPFGNDFLDITTTDDHSTTDSHDVTVSDFLNPTTEVDQSKDFDFLNPTIEGLKLAQAPGLHGRTITLPILDTINRESLKKTAVYCSVKTDIFHFVTV